MVAQIASMISREVPGDVVGEGFDVLERGPDRVADVVAGSSVDADPVGGEACAERLEEGLPLRVPIREQDDISRLGAERFRDAEQGLARVEDHDAALEAELPQRGDVALAFDDDESRLVGLAQLREHVEERLEALLIVHAPGFDARAVKRFAEDWLRSYADILSALMDEVDHRRFLREQLDLLDEAIATKDKLATLRDLP